MKKSWRRDKVTALRRKLSVATGAISCRTGNESPKSWMAILAVFVVRMQPCYEPIKDTLVRCQDFLPTPSNHNSKCHSWKRML